MRSLFIILCWLPVFASGAAPQSAIKADETVVFFPSLGWQNADLSWTLEIRGWVYEQERRPGVATAFRKAIGIDSRDLTAPEIEIYRQRSRLFLVDAERGKPVVVRFATNLLSLPPTAADGHFSARVQLSDPEVKALQTNQTIAFHALLPPDDRRVFSGSIQLLSATGFSIVSDLDDTIKISQVRQRDQLLRNTFHRPFTAVPGMARLYEKWATATNIAFHYVSASPSQLAPPIRDFLNENRFPPGSLHLSVFNWRHQLWQQSGTDPKAYKPGVIEPLLQQFPQRQFILVGDSGEMDPEIYGDIARKFPQQVRHVFIRDVTNDKKARYEKAFHSLPAQKWKVFRDPRELESSEVY